MSNEQQTPGSTEAIAAGCKCPRYDNHKGKGLPYPDGPMFVISELCPLHGKPNDRTRREAIAGRED